MSVRFIGPAAEIIIWGCCCLLFFVAGYPEPKSLYKNIAVSDSLFYTYYFGICSLELVELAFPSHSCWKCTHDSDRLHEFYVNIPQYYKDVYVSSFFPATSILWNSL